MAERYLGQRSKKRAEKWKKHFERQRELHRQIRAAGADILKSRNFHKTKEYIQHGNMTVNNHCMNVARYSLELSDKLPAIAGSLSEARFYMIIFSMTGMMRSMLSFTGFMASGTRALP